MLRLAVCTVVPTNSDITPVQEVTAEGYARICENSFKVHVVFVFVNTAKVAVSFTVVVVLNN